MDLYTKLLYLIITFVNLMLLTYLIGRVDYVAPRGDYVEAIVPGGQTTASFSISLINDDIIEGDEFFEITVLTESLPHGYTWVGDETVRVYILDDDGKYYRKWSLYYY